VLKEIGLFSTKHPKSAKTTARLTYLGFRFRCQMIEEVTGITLRVPSQTRKGRKGNEKLFEFATLQRVVEGNTGTVL
jgi:hypothetical protein